MGRYPRPAHPGLIYHVIQRGNNKEVVFAENADYIHYLNNLQRYKKKFAFKLFAFCLMTNHVHLLLKVSDQGTISKIMQSLTVAHTRHFNYKYQRCGHVWQGRFMSPLVSEDEYFLNVMRYIEQNPLRAGMEKAVGGYKWSSYRLNIRTRKSILIDRSDNTIFQSMADDEEQRVIRYKKLLGDNLVEDTINKIRLSTQKGDHYLSPRFKEQIALLLPNKKPRGRPRKTTLNLFKY